MTSGSFGLASQAYGSVTVSPWCVRSVGTCLAIGGVGADEDSVDGTVLMSGKSRPCRQNQNQSSERVRLTPLTRMTPGPRAARAGSAPAAAAVQAGPGGSDERHRRLRRDTV